MKITKKILIILIIISTFLSGFLYINPVQAVNSNSSKSSNVPKPDFTLASEGAILMDSSTGAVLYGKNENEKLYPASTTKILTAILAIEHCKPAEKITASYDAVMSLPSGYSNAAIQPGESLYFQDLLDMFLIHSANETLLRVLRSREMVYFYLLNVQAYGRFLKLLWVLQSPYQPVPLLHLQKFY